MSRPNTGSMQEVRPDVWRVRVSHGYKKDGTQRRASATVRGKEEDASVALVRMSTEMGKSPNIGDELSFREYVYGVFLPNRKDLTKATLDSYESIFRCHIDEAFGDTKLSEVTRQKVQAWLSRQSAESAKNRMRAMSAMLHGAVEDGLLDSPPYLARMRYPRRGYVDPVADSWGVEEVNECLSLLQGDRIYPLWLVMVGAGLSRSEACALEWSDVHVDGAVLVDVTKARTEKDGLKEPKNRFRRRTVPVAEPFGERLLACACTGCLWNNTPAYAGVYWRKLFGSTLEGLPFVHLNRMRATHETLLQQAGTLDSVNARMHGRSNVQTGYEHYQATRLGTMIAASEGLRELLES